MAYIMNSTQIKEQYAFVNETVATTATANLKYDQLLADMQAQFGPSETAQYFFDWQQFKKMLH